MLFDREIDRFSHLYRRYAFPPYRRHRAASESSFAPSENENKLLVIITALRIFNLPDQWNGLEGVLEVLSSAGWVARAL